MANSLSLYQCERDLAAALDAALDRETGEIATTDELDNAVGRFNNKATHVAAYVLNLEVELGALAQHQKTIDARKKAMAAKIQRLRDYMSTQMKNAAISRINALDGTFNVALYQDRDEAIEIEQGAPVDARFARTIPESREWDKAALKAAIKAGEPVPSCVKLVKRDRLVIT
jgi:hypothetical protein